MLCKTIPQNILLMFLPLYPMCTQNCILHFWLVDFIAHIPYQMPIKIICRSLCNND